MRKYLLCGDPSSERRLVTRIPTQRTAVGGLWCNYQLCRLACVTGFH